MILISKVEIQYFRSIYKVTISDLKDLNIFTGMNDVGKSNILKALNLFFNNEIEPGVPFVFTDNFNFDRLNQVRKDSVKGKQFIQIKITFIRGKSREKTLPESFTVTKKWFRNDTMPSVITDDLQKQFERRGLKYNDRNKSSLTAFINKVKYVYVPAIKDDKTFKSILASLETTLYNNKLTEDSDLVNALTILAERISTASEDLNKEFKEATKISSNLTSPKNISELYKTLDVETFIGSNPINLDKRGDGIRVRYLPSMLHYISSNSKNLYIWGFEEPENSLEYRLATKMANDFLQIYSKHNMILTTSHSPVL